MPVSPVQMPEPLVDPPRWLKVDPTSITHLDFEDLQCSRQTGAYMWVTAHDLSGASHRFCISGLHSQSNSEALIRTAATPAVGKWTEVDESGEPVVHQRPVITVSSDRQIGKTDLLLLVAARDAVLLNKWVVYDGQSAGISADAMGRFLALYAGYVASRVSRTNGEAEVSLRGGGRVLFRWVGQGPWRGVADTHLVDADEIPPWRYCRGNMPARIYHAVTTGDGRPL